MPDIQGYCPMGCGETLFIGEGGYITCRRGDCPRPDAVVTLLEDVETEHRVTFTETGFTVRHPLRERLDDALMACVCHEYVASLSAFGPPIRVGQYRARQAGDGTWSWEEV